MGGNGVESTLNSASADANKNKTQTPTAELSAKVSQTLSRESIMTVEQKAFRVPVIATVQSEGKSVHVAIPKSSDSSSV